MRNNPAVALPALLPTVLAVVVAAASVVAIGARSLEAAGGGQTWLQAWAVALGLSLLATMRRRWPAFRTPASGSAWALAGVAGCALLVRHAMDCIVLAAQEAPWSTGDWMGFDLGEGTIALALAILSIPAVVLGGLRRPRPLLLFPSLVALVLLLSPLVLALLDTASGAVATGGSLVPPVLLAGCLAWTAALVGPAALPLRAHRTFLDRALPRFALAGVLVGLPWAVLATAAPGRVIGGGEILLAEAGARAFGRYGDRIGAGCEGLFSLLAAVIVLVLAGRVAARALPWLRSGALIGLVALAAVASAWLPLPTLIFATGIIGWVAVLLGPEEAPWVPAGSLEVEALVTPPSGDPPT